MSTDDIYAARKRVRLSGAPPILYAQNAPIPPLNLPLCPGEGIKAYTAVYDSDTDELRQYRAELTDFLDARSQELQDRFRASDLPIEIHKQRVREKARDVIRREKAEAEFAPPPYRRSLAEELAVIIEPPQPRIEGLSYVGQNVLLSAKAKAGKTTLSVSLARSLADGEPFLGSQGVTPPAGNIGVLNYEMTPAQHNQPESFVRPPVIIGMRLGGPLGCDSGIGV
ncbi:AAA family ATPase [Modestobacter sp. DSM 44400]|uniref:AAA family ATPase n=1 Tax=Modestobacter sp. DSM 44400 TaxID=1550230 RepID=UPI001C316732|nr:AAA family ATPase [Modestobacter sp. DSM 44400]